MKICTWNLMRPSERSVLRNETFLNELRMCDADIFILTETNSLINPGSDYHFKSTTELPASFEGLSYARGENRAAIYSKFPFGRNFETADEYTSVCSEVLIPGGSLIIYATIIGVTGGKDTRFQGEFIKQKQDILQLSIYDNICIAGDFNISFSGYTYPGHAIVNEANQFFEDLNLDILTRNFEDSPDHIAISNAFIKQYSGIESLQKTFDKKITDHSLVSLILLP